MQVGYLLKSFPATSETFVAREIRGLQDHGIAVTVFSLRRPEETCRHEFAEKLASSVLYPLENGARFRTLARIIRGMISQPKKALECLKDCPDEHSRWCYRQAAAIAPAVARQGIKHVHVHFAEAPAEIALCLSQILGITYSFTAHAYDIFCCPRRLEDKVRKAEFVVTISNYNRDYIVNTVGSDQEENIHVIHCGLDVSKVRPPRPKRKLISDNLNILMVARFVPKKGHKTLLQALALNEVPTCQVRFIGSGPLKAQVAEFAKELGLKSQVEFLGSTSNTKVMESLKEADLFVLPCRIAENGDRDGIPVSLMEAMAMNIPVLTTEVSGIPELVKKGAGILVPPQDPIALANGLRHFSDLPPSRRHKMGEAGRRIVVDEFNLIKETKKLTRLFASISA